MARCIHCSRDLGASTFICPDCEGNKLLQRHNDLMSRQLGFAGADTRGVDTRSQMADALRPHIDAVLEGHRRAASELEDIRAGVGGLEETVRAGNEATIGRMDQAQALRHDQLAVVQCAGEDVSELVGLGYEQIGFSGRFEQQGDEMIGLQSRMVEQGDVTNDRLGNMIVLGTHQVGAINEMHRGLSDHLGDMGDIMLSACQGLDRITNEVVVSRMEMLAQLEVVGGVLSSDLRMIDMTLRRVHGETLESLVVLIKISARMADDLSDIKVSLRNPAQRRADEAIRIAAGELKDDYFDSAQRKYEEARDENPRDVRIYFGLGWIGIHKSDEKAAINNFKEARDRAVRARNHEESAAAAVLLGRVYYSLEDYGKAAGLLGKAVEEDRSNLEAQFRYAEYLCLSGQRKKAIAVLWKLVHKDAKFILRVRLSIDLEKMWPKLKKILESLTDKKNFHKTKNLLILVQQCMEFDLVDKAMKVLKFVLGKNAMQVLKSRLLLDYRFRGQEVRVASVVEQACCSLTHLQPSDYYRFAVAVLRLGNRKAAYSLFSAGAVKDVYMIRKDAGQMRSRLEQVGGNEFIEFLRNSCKGGYSWLVRSL